MNKNMLQIIIAVIGALALIMAAYIKILPEISNQQSTPPISIPPNALEAELSKANISLTETSGKENSVRQWLRDDQQYQVLANTILTALDGKRVINPIPLDVITGKYRVALGGKEDTNFPPDQYKDVEKTKIAMFDTWKERYPTFPQMSFDEIVE